MDNKREQLLMQEDKHEIIIGDKEVVVIVKKSITHIK